MDTDVLIVGAGPVGLTLGLLLSQFGVQCRIVDQRPGPVDTSNALGVHARTLELLNVLSLSQAFIDRGAWLDTVEIHSGGRVLAQIVFHDLQSMYRGVLSLPQSATERVLASELRTRGIVVERLVTFKSFDQDDDAVRVELEHNDGSRETVYSHWMVGCDGAHSGVRHALQLPFEGKSETQRFVLADLRMAWPLPHTQLSIFLHREGPVLTIPLPDGGHRVIAEITNSSEDSNNFTFDQLRTIFARRVPISAALSDAVWLSSFGVNRRHVSNYRVGRAFLAGDAAHVHSPAGGQGMNTGMQDAFNLAWKVALVHHGKARLELLESYSEERAPIARGVLELSDRLMQAATLKNPIVERIRDLALPLLAGSDFFQHNFLADLSEIGVNYRGRACVSGEGHFASSAPHPGDRAPLAINVSGKAFSEFLEPAVHNLLLFAGDTDSNEAFSMLLAARRDFQAAYPGLIHAHVITQFTHRAGPDVIVDEQGHIHRSYGAAKSCLFLVRPDLYVAYRGSPPDAVGLHQFLREAYGFRASHGAAKSSASS
jgi:2-polyprenyl-6-methoxyphenol hydroxylase-like FAD-dependent oxidoreductase